MNSHFNFPKVSVVIPTVGEDSLHEVILAINKGTLVPAEIIVCIPKEISYKAEHLKYVENVKILKTFSKGQVQQRIAGFNFVQSELVLQLDADLIVLDDTIKNLVVALVELGKSAAVCPLFYINYNTITPRPNYNTLFKRIFRSILNLIIDGRSNVPCGVITLAGIETCLPYDFNNKKYSLTEFLPGGCVLHWKKNLVLENYYPFPGKAYGEDVIHSLLLTKNGLSLYICSTAIIINKGYYLEQFEKLKDLYLFLKKTYAFRLKVVKIGARSHIRFHIWMTYFIISKLFIFLFRRNND